MTRKVSRIWDVLCCKARSVPNPVFKFSETILCGLVDGKPPHYSSGTTKPEAAMETKSIRITVFGEDTAEANQSANELESWLDDRVEGLSWAERTRENKSTQDLGTVLIALLSAPAAVALAKDPAKELAKGMADWLRKRRGSFSITVKGKEIKIENADTATIERVIRDVLDEK
jgi:hypothetical protein